MSKIFTLLSILSFLIFTSCGSGGKGSSSASDKGGRSGKSCMSFSGAKDQDMQAATMLSLGIYQDNSFVAAWLKSVPNFNKIEEPLLSIFGDMAGILYTPNGDKDHPILLIVLRGTADEQDAMTNYDFALQKYSDSRSDLLVHQGYNLKVAELLSENSSSLASVARDTPIYIMGHSQGGALAMIMAMRLSGAGYNVSKVFAFGSPKIGNKEFHDEVLKTLGTKLEIVSASADPVPSLPASWSYINSKGITFNNMVINGGVLGVSSSSALVDIFSKILSSYPNQAMTPTTVLPSSASTLTVDQIVYNCTAAFADEFNKIEVEFSTPLANYDTVKLHLGVDISAKKFDPSACYPAENHLTPYVNFIAGKEACF